MSQLTGLLDRIARGSVPRRGPGLEPLCIPTTLRAGPRPAPPSSPGRLWIRGQPAPHNPRRLSPCVDRPVDNYSLVFPHLCPQMWMNHSGVLSALSFKASRAAQCFSGAVCLRRERPEADRAPPGPPRPRWFRRSPQPVASPEEPRRRSPRRSLRQEAHRGAPARRCWPPGRR